MKGLAHVQQHAWAVTEDAMQAYLAELASGEGDADAVQRAPGRRLNGTDSVAIRDGVAVIPIRGILFRGRIEAIASDFNAAMVNPEVRAIILEVNSPGGQVDGVEELAELIFRARDQKPVHAFVSHLAASGGYWLAASAAKIWVTKTSVLGSIGAMLSFMDLTKMLESFGIEIYHFISAVSPRKNPPLSTEIAQEEYTRMVDDLGEVFVQTVADYRGTTREDVVTNYGQGGIMVGQRAVDATLADGVSTLEDLITKLAEERFRPAASVISGRAGAHSPEAQEVIVATDKEKAEAKVLTAQEVKDQYPDAASALREEGAAEARAEAEAQTATAVEAATGEARTAERERILGIQALHAAGCEKLQAELVLDPAVSIEGAAARILTAQGDRARAQGDAFIQGRQKDEEIPAPTPSTGTDASDRQQKVRNILTAGRARANA